MASYKLTLGVLAVGTFNFMMITILQIFFSFETSNGLQRSESGTLVNKGQPNEHIKVRGYYSYSDPDGKYVQINYTADENGYHVEPFSPSVMV